MENASGGYRRLALASVMWLAVFLFMGPISESSCKDCLKDDPSDYSSFRVINNTFDYLIAFQIRKVQGEGTVYQESYYFALAPNQPVDQVATSGDYIWYARFFSKDDKSLEKPVGVSWSQQPVRLFVGSNRTIILTDYMRKE